MSVENRRPAESTGQRRRRSLKRRSQRLLVGWMGRAEAPERVAAAVAVGVGVGLSPFIGFHFILAVVFAFILRLNKLDAVLGSFAGNPWTLPAVYALGYRVGRMILGFPPARVPPLQWHRILHSDFWVAFRGPGFEPRMASFLVGTTLVALVGGLATYLAGLGLLKLYHRRHPRVAERAARRREREGLPPVEKTDFRPEDRVH